MDIINEASNRTNNKEQSLYIINHQGSTLNTNDNAFEMANIFNKYFTNLTIDMSNKITEVQKYLNINISTNNISKIVNVLKKK